MNENNEFMSAAMEARHYPSRWERTRNMNNGMNILVRPILPEDKKLYKAFMQKNLPEDIRHRFFETLRDLTPELLEQLTSVDYKRTMAFVALDQENGDLLGVSRYAVEAKTACAEFAVMTRSDVKGQGIGFALTEILISYAKTQNIHALWGQVSRDNAKMVQMCKDLQFRLTPDVADPCCVVATLPVATTGSS